MTMLVNALGLLKIAEKLGSIFLPCMHRAGNLNPPSIFGLSSNKEMPWGQPRSPASIIFKACEVPRDERNAADGV